MPKFIKMVEEIGELGELILMLEGYKYNKREMDDNKIKDEIKYECADVLMMLVIINKIHGHTFENLIEATDRKLDKWEHLIREKLKKY